MNSIVPMLLLWMWGQRCETPKAKALTVPFWPTPASPPPPLPPPMPAFQAQPSANSGTPFSELIQPPPAAGPLRTDPYPELKSPPKAAPPRSAPPKRPTPATRPRQPTKALAAARKKVTFGLKQRPISVPLPPQRSASVLDLQKILSARGAKLVKDGLYGPKTANAWSTIANKKGLPPMISRVGPKIAKVVPQTYDALSVPAIP